MDAPYSPIEFRLLNDFQRGFPLQSRPFAALAQTLEVGELDILASLRRLQAKGAVSRVGAVFAPRSVGASTLAALAVPAARLEDVAAQVSGRPQVNHNYQREHRFNLWFVATAADEAMLADVLDGIRAESGCPLIALPMAEEFHIDLGFDLAGGTGRPARHGCNIGSGVRRELAPDELRLLTALQPGLELVPQPFAQLARQAGVDEAFVLARIDAWLAGGIVKRFGIVVRHHELGYRANAMVVFNVPDDKVGEVGRRLAHEEGVTLCYRRNRSLPDWPYNLFCMVHGRSREDVEPVVARLCRVAGYGCEVLFSTRRFKQQGAHYFHAP